MADPVRAITEAIPEEVMEVARRLRGAGHAVFVVGGAVRDLLLGRRPEDWDLATSARPDQMRPLFAGWRLVEVGARHGTLGVVAGGRVVEVTTFRVEGPYRDRRHPDFVRFVDTLREDLARRDFTVNALALDPSSGELHDPWGGLRDLERGLVRAVGDPAARFREDALRLLRAFRLVAEYGWDLDAATAEAVEACAPLATGVAAERVRTELERVLAAPHAGRALALMERHRLLGELFPGYDFGGVPWPALDRLPARVELRLAALLLAPHLAARPAPAARSTSAARATSPAAPAVRALLERWRFPAGVTTAVTAMVRAWPPPVPPYCGPGGPAADVALRRWMAAAGRDAAEGVALITRELLPGGEELHRRVSEELARRIPLSVEELPVSGRDVMEVLGTGPGPRVGAALRELLALVWEDPSLNDRKKLLGVLERRAAGAGEGTRRS